MECESGIALIANKKFYQKIRIMNKDGLAKLYKTPSISLKNEILIPGNLLIPKYNPLIYPGHPYACNYTPIGFHHKCVIIYILSP